MLAVSSSHCTCIAVSNMELFYFPHDSLKEFLPKEYVKSKNIEKKIKEVREFKKSKCCVLVTWLYMLPCTINAILHIVYLVITV